jgi:hypothetical protein
MSTPTRPCVTCGTTFAPVGKDRYCSDVCRCGTDAGYNRGCSCERCRWAHARNHRRLRYVPNPTVDATGTRRRIEALARLGWSTAELSRHLGRHRSYLLKVLRNQQLEVATVLTVRRLYDELSMTWCTTPTAGRVAADARTRGWAAPLEWDEGTIDDPAAAPYSRGHRSVDLDEVVVNRFMAGDHTLVTTRAERVEIVARWRADGRPLRQLEKATGWNLSRYYDANADEQVAS